MTSETTTYPFSKSLAIPASSPRPVYTVLSFSTVTVTAVIFFWRIILQPYRWSSWRVRQRRRLFMFLTNFHLNFFWIFFKLNNFSFQVGHCSVTVDCFSFSSTDFVFWLTYWCSFGFSKIAYRVLALGSSPKSWKLC